MNSAPLVSVVIVTYKPNLDYISQAINSVKKQTYKNIEIIIINDKSTDEVESYFVELKNNNKNIIYVCNEAKKWVATARNQWILLSKWDYIAMLDDDDYWNDKNKIEKQVEYLENNEDFWFVWVYEVVNIDQDGKEINRVKCVKPYNDIKQSLLRSNQFAQSGIIIRRESLYKSWIYDTSCFTEDYDLWCRIWKFYKFCNIDSSISYRIQKNSLSHKNVSKVRVGAFNVFWKYKKFYPNFLKALIIRLWGFVLPEKIKDSIVKNFKI